MGTTRQTRYDVKAFETLLEFMLSVKIGDGQWSRTNALDYLETCLKTRRKEFPHLADEQPPKQEQK